MEGAGAFVLRRRDGHDRVDRGASAACRGLSRRSGAERAVGKPTIINNVLRRWHMFREFSKWERRYSRASAQKIPGDEDLCADGARGEYGAGGSSVWHDAARDCVEHRRWHYGRRRKDLEDRIQAVQIGGPSGGCLTEEHLDLPLAYESLRAVGAMVGSGGLVAMNQGTCMVSIARFFMEFTQRESCGKCVLCREGTNQLLALLDDVIEGRADAGTLELLEKLGHAVQWDRCAGSERRRRIRFSRRCATFARSMKSTS